MSACLLQGSKPRRDRSRPLGSKPQHEQRAGGFRQSDLQLGSACTTHPAADQARRHRVSWEDQMMVNAQKPTGSGWSCVVPDSKTDAVRNRYGSLAEVGRHQRHVCLGVLSGLPTDIAAGEFRANSRHRTNANVPRRRPCGQVLRKNVTRFACVAPFATQSCSQALGRMRLRFANQRPQPPWRHWHRINFHAEWT